MSDPDGPKQLHVYTERPFGLKHLDKYLYNLDKYQTPMIQIQARMCCGAGKYVGRASNPHLNRL